LAWSFDDEVPVYATLHRLGASLDVVDNTGWSLIHVAAAEGECTDGLRWLVEEQGIPVDQQTADGRTPLSIAASYSNVPVVVDYLISAGADQTAVCAKGRTPAHWAARDCSNGAILRRLIDSCGDPNVAAEGGVTMLHLAAARNKQRRAIELIVDAGGNPNATTTKAGNNALHLAFRYNPDADKVICWLIGAGVDVNHVNNAGITPLMWSVEHADAVDPMRNLLIAGADVNFANENGHTALMMAAANASDPETVTMLLNAGADATLQDATGRRAIDHAKKNKAMVDTPQYWMLNDASYE
jgi:ankyrin repeat protein